MGHVSELIWHNPADFMCVQKWPDKQVTIILTRTYDHQYLVYLMQTTFPSIFFKKNFSNALISHFQLVLSKTKIRLCITYPVFYWFKYKKLIWGNRYCRNTTTQIRTNIWIIFGWGNEYPTRKSSWGQILWIIWWFIQYLKQFEWIRPTKSTNS